MTATLPKLLADFDTQLASGVAIGDTTATLVSATDDDGVALPTGTYGLTIDAGNNSKEYTICTLTSTALTSVVSISRQGASTSGFTKTHRRGAKVTVTDWAVLSRMMKNIDGTTGFDSGVKLGYDADPGITSGDVAKFATVKFVNDTAIAGSPDATTTIKGISKMSVAPASATSPIAVGDNDGRVPTQAENDALIGTSGSPSSSNKYVTADDVSNTGVSAKIVRLNGTSYPAGDGSALTNIAASPVLTGIASGENITAGQPVFINPSDSTVYKAHGWKEINTASFTLPATNANLKLAKLSTTQFLALKHNGGTTLSVTLFTTSTGAVLDTATVTTAFDQSIANTTTLPQCTVCRLSDTTFVVIYAHTADNNLYFRTGSVSGSTINMDTETVYPTSPTYCYGFDSVPGASDGKVAFTYFDNTSESGTGGNIVPTLSYLTITTNSITVTATVVNTTYTTGGFYAQEYWSVVAFTNGIAYGMFSASEGNYRTIRYNSINTNDNSTIANLKVTTLESDNGTSPVYSQYIPSFVGHNGKAYFGWSSYEATINVQTILEINQAGCKIIYQSTTLLSDGYTTVASLRMAGNECGVFACVGLTGNTSSIRGNIYIQKDKIYEFYNGTVLFTDSFANPAPQMWFSNQKDEIVVGSNTEYLKTWRLPTPVDGMAVASVTSPAAPVIYTAQMTTSSLTANAQYFLKDTYTTTGDMDFKGIIPVGRALSTTVMKIITS